MSDNELVFKSALELSALIKRKQVSPVDVVGACLDRIESLNPRLNAFITILRDRALSHARQAEADIQRGRYLGPLHGIPYGAKDIFATKGIRTTNGSKATADWIPDRESAVTENLNKAGAILVGKLNLSEFAIGADAATSGFGPPRNPWNTDYSAGGSSNGSGSALAASLVPLALGTDTGGSIRRPASYCSIVGLKPTYGRVSRFGITPLSWTLDHAGPMARTVSDAALMLQTMAGHDDRDNTSAADPVPDYSMMLTGNIKGIRVGVLDAYMDFVNPEIRSAVESAIGNLAGLGATVVHIGIDHLNLVEPAYSFIIGCEGACVHERRLRDQIDRIDPAVLLALVPAKFVPATDYIKAQRVRTMVMTAVEAAFRQCDLIVCPTMAVLPYRLDLSGASPQTGPNIRALANVTGIPAISVPCGFSNSAPAMPIGMMLHAKPFDEATLLRVAHAYEQATEWHKRRPPLAL